MLRPVRRRPVLVDKNNQPETFYLDIRLSRQRRGALGARIEVSRFGSLGRVNGRLTRVQQFFGDAESGITGAKFVIFDPALPVPTAIDSAASKRVRPTWFIEELLEERLGSEYHKFHFPVEGYWPETRHMYIRHCPVISPHTYFALPESCQLPVNLIRRANI